MEADFDRLGLELAALEKVEEVKKGVKGTFEVDKLAETLPDDRSETLVPLLELLERGILRSAVVSSCLRSLKASSFRVYDLERVDYRFQSVKVPGYEALA